jgi:hypothetical protein
VLALPVIPAAFFLSVFALAGSTLLPSLSVLLAYPAYLLLAFVRTVSGFVADLPFSSVTVSVPVFLVVFWYVTLSGGAVFLIRRQHTRLLSYVTYP